MTSSGIPGSTLSHYLEKLKNEDLVTVHREGTFLRYAANSEALKDLLAFLYAECCSRTSNPSPLPGSAQALGPGPLRRVESGQRRRVPAPEGGQYGFRGQPFGLLLVVQVDGDWIDRNWDRGTAVWPTARVEGAREFLSGYGFDVDAIAPLVDGRFFSGFIRAQKPVHVPQPA